LFAAPAALVIALVCARLGWPDGAIVFSVAAIAALGLGVMAEREVN